MIEEMFKKPTYTYTLPLRKYLNVGISGVPNDLTTEEAERVFNFLKTLVIPEKKND